ncbi:BTAD domain-containing putative transcriptional regulator [Sinosporangium siamense]|uniref:SARP family transcriptional regulator n=1 Tax=Sinosporangium siamense TaxID=1367973 RepID=A0A919VBD0_9ACTN|nr:BTAD domain-containing putative transcriptional regulator [Sinosporangium siamense]GII97293.1 SARP family transcriptional regulator [Sinosporangium siamense]
MRFGVLGPLSVWTADGRPVRVPEVKVRALLADLLVHEGRPVPADRLAYDLWGDDPPGNPTNTLQTKVSQLRRALGEEGRKLVVYQAAGYVLHSDQVDAITFAALLDSARAEEDPRAKAALLSDALALWRGPAYADFRDEDFVRAAAALLEERRLTALEEWAEVRLALGEHSLLADELGAAVAEQPLRERLRAAYMRALYRSGRQSEALTTYTEFRELLDEELGLAPGPELAELQQAILRQAPGLLPAEAHAVRPRANRPPPLPASLTGLVGRDGDVAEVRALLRDSRLVTVTGPGGVGKTRLALASVAGLSPPEGVWLVELAGTAGSGAVAEAVADVLGMRDEHTTAEGAGTADLARRLANSLRGRELLLILDNCEHLIEQVADLVALLLRTAPGLRVLATSQESLAVVGEALYPVAPLPLPDAVRLFVERAGRGLTLSPETATWVETICARLDGLPLALELAAARVRALGVRGVAERLDDRFRLLTGTARGLPTRQQTLRAVIDWSWEQLTHAQRTALCALATHPGGCTAEAAEAVGVDVDLLDQLVNRSMVVADPPRYRLLESISAYCLDSLADDDPVFTLRDDYYLALAERAAPYLRGPRQREWLRRLDDETLNLRAVAGSARLAEALAWYWYIRGRHGEGHRYLAAVSPGTATEAAFAMLTGAGRGEIAGFPDARARWFVAHAHLHLGDAAAAAPLLGEALAEFRAAGDRWGEAAALAGLAKQAVFLGDLAAVERHGEESLRIFTELGDQWGRLQAADTLAYLAEINGDHGRAARLHREGLRVAEELHLWTDMSYRLSSLGRIALLTGDLAESRELHERARRLAAEQSHRFAEEFARVGLGLTARRASDFDTAERLFGESLEWNRSLAAGKPYYGVTLILAELGFLAEQRGDAGRAGALHLEGLAAARELGDPRAIALAEEGLAGVAALEGRSDEALRLLEKAGARRESVGAPLPAAERGDVDRIRALARGRAPAGPR